MQATLRAFALIEAMSAEMSVEFVAYANMQWQQQYLTIYRWPSSCLDNVTARSELGGDGNLTRKEAEASRIETRQATLRHAHPTNTNTTSSSTWSASSLVRAWNMKCGGSNRGHVLLDVSLNVATQSYGCPCQQHHSAALEFL